MRHLVRRTERFGNSRSVFFPIHFNAVFFCALFLVVSPPALLAREGWRAPSDVAQLKNPVAQKKEALARGKALYLDRCIDCHGKRGNGDGPQAADLNVHPTNLMAPPVRQQSDGELFWKISEGRKPMPGYARKLSEDERWSVVAYLRSLSR